MRIAFLCGCAEPGKDGVGDYTALLAEECRRRGHAVLVVALNDEHAAGPEADGTLVRLGAGMDRRTRFERAREAVESFAADIVSLQWVPYSFDPKGIPWGIDNALRRIAGGRAAQMMCHEIWIGAETGASLAHRLAGAAQRAVMRRVFRALRPACVQTSNPAYAAVLRRAGIEAEVLPLFGSIPVTAPEFERQPGIRRFGMFGELHPAWPPEPLLGSLRALGGRIELAHIGRIGKGEALWRQMEERHGRDIAFTRHGEQPAERVSRFLMEMDFGIATTPLALIGKSGTAAAMLEHGLPVIVNRNDVRYPEPGTPPPGVIVFAGGDRSLSGALDGARRGCARSRLPEVADQFIQGLRKTLARLP